ncbi:hypothetical protein [Streptomyces sp. NPDC102347]|uniref:hypothetical protein n=1 Tax=Streptomyces sp. NPDC102347 TaxID=3366157 RepID=UPI0037F75A6B
MVRRTGAIAVVVLFGAALLPLTSCSSASEASGSAKASASATRATPPRTVPLTPSPAGPCADGTCEVEVGVGDVVTVPETYALGPIEVTEVAVAVAYG